MAFSKGSFTQAGASAAGCAGASETSRLCQGGFVSGSHAGGGWAAPGLCPIPGKLPLPFQRVLGYRITSTLSSGQERCRLPPTALGMLMLHQGQNRRQWTLCSIPMPRCCHCPPWLHGNGSWGWSMPSFTFQMGFLAPGQAAFRVVKYFGKPHLSFSLKRLLLGKRCRANPGMKGSTALPDTSGTGAAGAGGHWCPAWGALGSQLGRVAGEQRKGQKRCLKVTVNGL